MTFFGLSWQAFHESLAHFAYWAIVLVVLFGLITWYIRWDARKRRRRYRDK